METTKCPQIENLAKITPEQAAKNYTDSSEWLIGENLEHIDAAFIAGAKWDRENWVVEYVRFVAHVRHTQRRYFTFRKPEILEESRRLEKELDTLNAYLLDPTPKLF